MTTVPVVSAPSSEPSISRPPSIHSSIFPEDGTLYHPGNSPVGLEVPHKEPSRIPAIPRTNRSLTSQEFSEAGEEASENSIIWHIYNEEASKADTSMVEASHREIDVLLVFTGLFSAVLTTFIIQVYQMVLSDPADRTNELLSSILALQSGGSGANVVPRDRSSDPSITQIRWVNGLWFSALACSLSTALVSMLAKQWLHAYARHNSGSPRDRARKRQKRFMHFRAWHVLTVINSLPLLLHTALFLFFGGVIVLLWTDEMPISVATVIIVVLAYIFYTTSIWISLVSPDCPYQHPISAHLHRWLKSKGDWHKVCTRRRPKPKRDLESTGLLDDIGVKDSHSTSRALNQTRVQKPGDILDANVLIWLLNESVSAESARNYALQAIAGLPRDFTADQLLRQAGAVEMILEKFESCFQLDVTLGSQWFIRDPHVAEKYCRGWLRLTYQTKLKWPDRLLQPLHMLSECTSQPAVSATATCVLALTSLEKFSPQSELISLLARHVDGQVSLSWSVQEEIVDTLLECIAHWELSVAAIGEIVSRAVPILIRLLHSLGNVGPAKLRHAVSLSLHALTGGFLDDDIRREEDKRNNMYWDASIQALSKIVQQPACYKVEDDSLLDMVALELARLAPVLVTKSHGFPQGLCESIKAAFTSLCLQNRITTREVSEDTLADILNLLYPPVLAPDQQGPFTCYLVDALKRTTHPNVICNALRLLDSYFASHSVASVKAFITVGGVEVLLHIANIGNIDSRGLQMYSLRTLCAFVRTSVALHLQDRAHFPSSHFDAIFQSDFLKTLCAMTTTGKWWSTDVATIWAPALVRLCGVRPADDGWRSVERTLWKYAGLHQTESGHGVLLDSLNCIRELRRGLEGGAGKSFFEGDF